MFFVLLLFLNHELHLINHFINGLYLRNRYSFEIRFNIFPEKMLRFNETKQQQNSVYIFVDSFMYVWYQYLLKAKIRF